MKEITWCELSKSISPNLYGGDANWHWVSWGIVGGKPLMLLGCRKGNPCQITVEVIAGKSKPKVVVESINEGKRIAQRLISNS